MATATNNNRDLVSDESEELQRLANVEPDYSEYRVAVILYGDDSEAHVVHNLPP